MLLNKTVKIQILWYFGSLNSTFWPWLWPEDWQQTNLGKMLSDVAGAVGIETSPLLEISNKFSSKVAASVQFRNWNATAMHFWTGCRILFSFYKRAVQGDKNYEIYTTLWMPCSFQRKDADLVAQDTDWEEEAAAAGLIQNVTYLCLSFPHIFRCI